jgi:hypothetical protein
MAANIPPEKLRWDLRRASEEFAVGYHVLRRKLVEAGEQADPAGCYKTAQLTRALFDSLHAARVEKIKVDTERSKMAARAEKGELIDRAALSETFGRLADALKSHIMNDTTLSREAREDVCRELASWPVVLEDAAQKGRKKTAPSRG